MITKHFSGFDVRFELVDGESIITHGTDLAKALYFSNPAQSLTTHVWAEYRFKHKTGVGQPPWFLVEAGVWQLIFAAEHQKAVEVQRWIFEDVLPSIRKNGVYVSPDITLPQAIAARDNLNRILDAAAPWERLYDENRNKGFKWFGYRFYNDYVYCFLTAEEWCKINQLNPVRKEVNGRCDRLERIHQYIEPKTKSRLRDTVATILGFVDVSNTPEEFQELYRRKYGRVEQLRLELGEGK